ncbi:MAG: uracil-DNA glycosylase [Desulfurivibrionaceae bacterium]|nr:uracil-DNA glycosylase [Pseudomonadota bacterium]MCG2824404.1 uracil-DNA glycosylase [Desulfobulbaceae bacterium]MDP2001728.1 uracil-DNA glycosylase [Desulfurivibrionaceae bacterium]PKN21144.1 MAG: uracil-DNA glycosylase [Deltaproteobacteria bacterium HGW-Deltaproteobacteria-3]
MPSPTSERPNCLACLHFYVTYEPAHPYGCRALNFKSLQYPSMVVFASSGIHCQVFSAKNRSDSDRS